MSKEFMVETSARHVHVTEETLEALFGKGYKLTVKKELSQPGQFASNERVTVVGPKKELANVSILGPCRKFNQVELSATDARSIGIDAPIRESGDIKGSGKCTLVGPNGSVELEEGVIVAKRHIHMQPADAAEFGVKNGDIVSVLIENGNGRKTIFGDTVIRVSDSFRLAMHVDTDESNAAACAKGQMGTIVK
jgi:putative phosphotransacetylase